MSGDAETLAEEFRGIRTIFLPSQAANAVLASDWLAARDAAIRAEALEDAAQYAEEIDALGRTPSIQFTDAQRQTWRDSHLGPLVPVGLSYRPRQIIAEWLRARAAALRAAQPTEETR